MTRRSRGGSSRPAASTSTGSASTAVEAARSWVPAATTLAWAGEMAPSVRAVAVWLRGRGTGPGRSAHSCWPPRGPGAARVRSQPAVAGGLDTLVGPGGPAGIRGGQLLEPVAFQAVDQPPQPQDPLGPGRRRPGRPGPGQPAHRRLRPGTPACPAAWSTAWSNVCSAPWGQPIKPSADHKRQTPIWGQLPSPTSGPASRGRPCRVGGSRRGAERSPGEGTGDGPTHRKRQPHGARTPGPPSRGRTWAPTTRHRARLVDGARTTPGRRPWRVDGAPTTPACPNPTVACAAPRRCCAGSRGRRGCS
jgi:hypothetical protein